MSGDSRGLSEHLNREFSPSVWSKRFSQGDLVIHHHVNYVEAESSKVIQDVKCELDLPYGSGDREKFDIFGIDLPDDSPIVVFTHGGFWHELSRQQSRYLVKPLHDMGIKTIVLGYDLCPTVTLKQIIEQIKNAILKVFTYASEKNSRAIYIIGHSAGGHLVAKFLADKIVLKSIPNLNVLQGVFLVSGVYDLTELIKTHENQYLNLSLEDAKSLSPQMDNYYHMRSLSLRLYILVAEHDSYTFKKQSRNFYDMLMESCQVQNIHFEIKDKFDHFDIMEVLSEPENYLNTLLLEDLAKIRTK